MRRIDLAFQIAERKAEAFYFDIADRHGGAPVPQFSQLRADQSICKCFQGVFRPDNRVLLERVCSQKALISLLVALLFCNLASLNQFIAQVRPGA